MEALSAGVRIECDQFVYELLDVRLIHAKYRRPLYAIRSPAPLLSHNFCRV